MKSEKNKWEEEETIESTTKRSMRSHNCYARSKKQRFNTIIFPVKTPTTTPIKTFQHATCEFRCFIRACASYFSNKKSTLKLQTPSLALVFIMRGHSFSIEFCYYYDDVVDFDDDNSLPIFVCTGSWLTKLNRNRVAAAQSTVFYLISILVEEKETWKILYLNAYKHALPHSKHIETHGMIWNHKTYLWPRLL